MRRRAGGIYIYAGAMTGYMIYEKFVRYGVVPKVHSPLTTDFTEKHTYVAPKEALEYHMNERIASNMFVKRMVNPLHRIKEKKTFEWSEDNDELLITVELKGVSFIQV